MCNSVAISVVRTKNNDVLRPLRYIYVQDTKGSSNAGFGWVSISKTMGEVYAHIHITIHSNMKLAGNTVYKI